MITEFGSSEKKIRNNNNSLKFNKNLTREKEETK
jgi:hypothetical protein